MAADRLTAYARLPRAYRDRNVLHSTVDAFGRAHWLLREARGPGDLYDAVIVTVEDGRAYETYLASVRARFPKVDALPDGGFVVADSRRRKGDEHVQVFDPPGRPSWTFAVGDGIEQLLTDESGNLWVGYFDEGVGGDPLSEPGLRCWSSTGSPLWQHSSTTSIDWILECYALNVDRRAVWAYPYPDFPLLEVCDGRPATVRTTPVRSASAVVVHGSRVAFFGGYGDNQDRLVLGDLTETSVEPVEERRLLHPDGTGLARCRVVARGPRLYVQERPCVEWAVLDIS